MRGYDKLKLLYLVGTLVVVSAFDCLGQSTPTYSFKFSNTKAVDALKSIDKETDYSIFFREEWLDSLTFSGNYENLKLTQLIDSLLSPLGINHIVVNNSIILTGDISVTNSLTFDTLSSIPQTKYLFEREYIGDRKETVPIGNRSLMTVGNTAQIAGYVKNASTGEAVQGALIFEEGSDSHATTDAQGFFSIRLPTGDHTLLIQYSGLKVKRQNIILFSNGTLNVGLEEEPRLLEEVVITSDRNANVSSTQMGSITLNMESLKNVPKVLGENDIIQAALALPGVQQVGEGSAGINVRGGKTDQNLILLNNATIYNPFHFFGFFSSFNADITGSSELIKSGIPASYGGRLSSLLNMKMKVANKEKFSAKLGLSPVTTKASMEIPLIKDKTSLMVGARTTYSDWIIKRVPNETLKRSSPSFSDFALNLHHSYGASNSISLSGYYSHDQYKLSTDSTNRYTNQNASLEWFHLIHEKFSSTVSAGMGTYQFSINYESNPETAFNYGFKIDEQFGKALFNYFPSEQHDIQFGIEAKLYNLNPGELVATGASVITPAKLQTEKGFEKAFFASEEFKISPALTLYGGLRYSFFTALGARTINFYQPGSPRNSSTQIGSVSFEDGDVIDTYHGPEIRLSGKYSLSNQSSIKAGVTQMRQYIHALTSTVSVSPTDTWKLSDPNFAPQTSVQYSLGYYRDLPKKNLEFSAETYYKTLDNILDYKIGADLVLNETLETGVIQGVGRAYGLELLLRKPNGKLNGWIGYTYSRSQQKFDSQFSENRINQGNYFSSNFEKPHDISIVANYKKTRRFSFSMNVIYTSGRKVTYPSARYSLNGVPITHFSDRNSYRIPNYFRVDVSMNIEGSHKLKKIGHGYWSISIYNVLARKNVYSVFFTNSNGTIKGYQLSVLGTAIPSITYNLTI